jgi:hypothetical protein
LCPQSLEGGFGRTKQPGRALWPASGGGDTGKTDQTLRDTAALSKRFWTSAWGLPTTGRFAQFRS